MHNRGDWDLKRHGEFSGTDFTHTDIETGESYIPHVAEYSIGLNRLLLVVIADAYRSDENRTWLALNPKLSPYKAAVFPLLRNKPELVGKAREIYQSLVLEGISVNWDDRGNIGKRYLAQDEIGTPLCITVDFDTLEKNSVTIRDRDTMQQERVDVDKIREYIVNRIS